MCIFRKKKNKMEKINQEESGIKHDPQELLPENKEKFEAVDKIIAEKYKDFMYYRGACHVIWRERKRLLKELYNIDWKTPEELNPFVIFD